MMRGLHCAYCGCALVGEDQVQGHIREAHPETILKAGLVAPWARPSIQVWPAGVEIGAALGMYELVMGRES